MATIRHNPPYPRLDYVEPESWTVVDDDGEDLLGPFGSLAEAQAAAPHAKLE